MPSLDDPPTPPVDRVSLVLALLDRLRVDITDTEALAEFRQLLPKIEPLRGDPDAIRCGDIWIAQTCADRRAHGGDVAEFIRIYGEPGDRLSAESADAIALEYEATLYPNAASLIEINDRRATARARGEHIGPAATREGLAVSVASHYTRRYGATL
jgi:hypothetical protein